jgi:hypothetical protein
LRATTNLYPEEVPRFYLEVPTETQMLELLAGLHGATNGLPPPGMTKGYDASRLASLELDGAGVLSTATVLYVEGNPPPGEEDRWYWSTLGDFIVSLPNADESIITRILSLLSRIGARVLSDALSIPLLKKGKANGDMKWIRNTYRGILGGGVEEFQFKLDLGHPGADPDITAAQAQTLAEQLAGIFTDQTTGFRNLMSTEVAFTEVGCVMFEATSATAKDGSGGNAAQKYPTEWFMYPSGSRPLGISGSVSLPYEAACAVSLQTDKRGPSGKGRFYLPPFASSIMVAGGVYGGASVATVRDTCIAWIDAINDATPWTVVVVSPRQLVLNDVTSLLVGKVPDSQRRRRRSQDEAKVTGLVAV